jgi:hypothetical protein
LNVNRSLYQILQILSLNLFEKMPIAQALADESFPDIDDVACNKLELFT